MGPADLRELHKEMCLKCSRILDNKVRVEPFPASCGWEGAAVGAECEFELLPRHRAQMEPALRGGQRVSAIPLFGASRADWSTGHRYWVNWYERWRKADRTAFCLLTASWTVFRGIASYQDKMQLVRVEWDQLCNDFGSADAGQPHWHVDQPVPVTSSPAGAPSSGALQEYPPSRVGATGGGGDVAMSIEIHRVHLAMGAWDGKEPSPKCWQRHAHRWRDIHCWAVRSLEYIQAQFRNR